MKNSIPLAALLFGLLIIGCAGSNQSSSQGQELTREAFKTKVSSLTATDSTLALCQDYAERADDIDVVRDAQDLWSELDKDGAREHFERLYQENPNSARHAYLYGRLLSCRIERIEMGRKVIDLDPEWPYGYRLVLYCYYTHLFLGQGDQPTIDSLKANFARDSELFHKFDAMFVNRWFNGKMMFHFYLYKNDLRAAEDELVKAWEWGWNWAEEAEQQLQIRKGEMQESEDKDIKG